MTIIYQPGQSPGGTVQTSWELLRHGCGRPPTDFDLSVVCYNSRILRKTGSDMDYFAPCCPTRLGENIFEYDHGCGFMFCFTNDIAMAEAYPGCISNLTNMKLTDIGANGADAKNITDNRNSTNIMCEYVDYDSLRAGAKKMSDGSPRPGGGVWRAALASVVVLGLAQFFLSF